jgi:hypothetical protein
MTTMKINQEINDYLARAATLPLSLRAGEIAAPPLSQESALVRRSRGKWANGFVLQRPYIISRATNGRHCIPAKGQSWLTNRRSISLS